MQVQAAPETFDPAIMPRRIHVSQLQPGMTVFREKDNGDLVTDSKLLRRFATSSSPRYRLALAFVTTAKENVVWQNCGYVWVMGP